MKQLSKFIFCIAIALAFVSSPAIAEKDGDKEYGKHHGKMMGEMDTNDDGAVSKDEFLAHAEKKFAHKDKDGNGKIEKHEMKEAHQERKEKIKDHMKKRKEMRMHKDGETSE